MSGYLPDQREICRKHIPAARQREIILIITLIITLVSTLIMDHCSTTGFVSLFSSQKQKFGRGRSRKQQGQKGWVMLGRSFSPIYFPFPPCPCTGNSRGSPKNPSAAPLPAWASTASPGERGKPSKEFQNGLGWKKPWEKKKVKPK